MFACWPAIIPDEDGSVGGFDAGFVGGGGGGGGALAKNVARVECPVGVGLTSFCR